jgi:hypothetical protein
VKLTEQTIARLAAKLSPDMYDLGIRDMLVMPNILTDHVFLVKAPNRYARLVYLDVQTIIDRIELDPEGATI